MTLRPWGDIRNLLYDTPFGQRATHLNAGTGLYRLLAPRSVYAISGMSGSTTGAPTAAFGNAQRQEMAPLSGLGFIRIGEDGRAYFVGKSEHYHASLGHQFPGYRLIERAKRLGICNATHNNTRGHITRLAERELVRVANGLDKRDLSGLEGILTSTEPYVLNRVINLPPPQH